MSYFDQNPFASNIITPVRTDQAVGPITPLPPIDCTGFKGIRFHGISQFLFSELAARFDWFDNQNDALAGANVVARRTTLITTSGVCDFQVPHFADWLVITFTSLDAGQFQLTWAAAHRQYTANIFTGDYLILPATLTVLNGTTVNADSSGAQAATYAGPAVVQMDVTVAGGSGWRWVLTARQQDNSMKEIAMSKKDHEDNAGNAPRGQVYVIIPPTCFLNLALTNSSGADGNALIAVIADSWRTH